MKSRFMVSDVDDQKVPPFFIMLMRYLRKVEHIKHLKGSATEDPSVTFHVSADAPRN